MINGILLDQMYLCTSSMARKHNADYEKERRKRVSARTKLSKSKN